MLSIGTPPRTSRGDPSATQHNHVLIIRFNARPRPAPAAQIVGRRWLSRGRGGSRPFGWLLVSVCLCWPRMSAATSRAARCAARGMRRTPRGAPARGEGAVRFSAPPLPTPLPPPWRSSAAGMRRAVTPLRTWPPLPPLSSALRACGRRCHRPPPRSQPPQSLALCPALAGSPPPYAPAAPSPALWAASGLLLLGARALLSGGGVALAVPARSPFFRRPRARASRS